MRVTLKLFATLSEHLPPGAVRNAIDCDVGDGSTVRDVLDSYAVPLAKCHLILINGVYVAPAVSGAKRLVAGDTVAVWPPVAGG